MSYSGASSFLRRALILDGAISGATGLLMVLASVGPAARWVFVRLLAEVGVADESAQRAYRRSGLTETGTMLMALPLASPVHAD
jgi:hypothetical protein